MTENNELKIISKKIFTSKTKDYIKEYNKKRYLAEKEKTLKIKSHTKLNNSMQNLPDDEELNEIIQMIEIETEFPLGEIPDDPKTKKLFDAKIYYLNNKDKYKEYYKNRKTKTTQIEKVLFKCDMCNCSYFESHNSKHILTKKHREKMVDFMMDAFGITNKVEVENVNNLDNHPDNILSETI